MKLIDIDLLNVFWDAIKKYTGELKCTSEKAKKDINGNKIEEYYLSKNNVVNKGNENTPVYFDKNGVATPVSYINIKVEDAVKTQYLGEDTVGGNGKLMYLEKGLPKESTTTIGSSTSPVYVDNGTIVKSNSTIGSTKQPIYLNKGVITASNSTIGGDNQHMFIKDGIFTQANTSIGNDSTPIYQKGGVLMASQSTIGANNSFVYMDKGSLKASTTTVGSPTTPVYLNNGVFTTCNQYPVSYLLDKIYPIGSIYMSVVNTSPSIFLGGEWESINGKFLLSSDEQHIANTTGGEETHVLIESEMPKHAHTKGTMRITGTGMRVSSEIFNNKGCSGAIVASGTETGGAGENGDGGSRHGGGFDFDTNANGGKDERTGQDTWTGYTSFTGSNAAHNNMPPYLSVYMWKRTK